MHEVQQKESVQIENIKMENAVIGIMEWPFLATVKQSRNVYMTKFVFY